MEHELQKPDAWQEQAFVFSGDPGEPATGLKADVSGPVSLVHAKIMSAAVNTRLKQKMIFFMRVNSKM